MIVEFSVKNFRSIFDLQTISFVATGLSSSLDNSEVDESNVFTDGGQKLLKVIGLYGANASGKTNIVKALEYFCDAIGTLPSPESRLSKLAQPFLYQENSKDTESYFQIVVIVNGDKYRYGFTIKQNNTDSITENSSQEIITNEWLYGPKKSNQGNYFLRKGLVIEESPLIESNSIAPLEYEHTLFLTHVASYNKGVCAMIRNQIRGFTTTKFSVRSDFYRFHSIRQIEQPETKETFLKFLSSFGLDYEDIYYKNDDDLKKKNKFPLDRLFVIKNACYDSNEKVILNMQENESDGTKKLFDLAGLLLHAFKLSHTGLIILDEIDSNFHPSLLIGLIKAFNDSAINKSNIQLLFTSHDTNLLRPSIMRRDQFYFTEKRSNESTHLYSLAELRGIRNDANFAKQYLAGFYGSLPVLSEFTDDSNIVVNESMGN